MISSLWIEGTASYVSKVLCPQYDDGIILMDSRLGKLTHEALYILGQQCLHDERTLSHEKAYAKWFMFLEEKNKGVPTRAGYAVGMRVCEIVCKTLSLSEMAHLPLDEASRLVLKSKPIYKNYHVDTR